MSRQSLLVLLLVIPVGPFALWIEPRNPVFDGLFGAAVGLALWQAMCLTPVALGAVTLALFSVARLIRWSK